MDKERGKEFVFFQVYSDLSQQIAFIVNAVFVVMDSVLGQCENVKFEILFLV